MDLDSFMADMEADDDFTGGTAADAPLDDNPPSSTGGDDGTPWEKGEGVGDDPLESFMKEMEKQKHQTKEVRVVQGERVEEADEDDPMMSFLRHRKAEAKAKVQVDTEEGVAGDAEYDDDDRLLVPIEKKEVDPLKPIDHATMNYPSFKASFYTEGAKVAGLSDDQVQRMLTKLEIKVFWRGVKMLRPVFSFDHLQLDKSLKAVVEKMGFERPTPVQCQALPIALCGHNLLGIAKTGSGKTVAFVIPVLVHLLDQPALKKGDGPIALLLAPTRELCQQIHTECKRFAKPFGVRVAAVYGGVTKHEQFKELNRGAEVIVATPGRLIDLIKMKATNLHRVTCLVLDEADKMLNMGFEAQVRSVCGQIRPDRQTLFFSATFPRKVDRLANEVLKNKYVKVTVGESGQVNKDVTQIIHIMADKDKLAFVMNGAEHWLSEGSLLIFGGTKEQCEVLGTSLTAAGMEVGVLHGDKSQHERDVIMYNFKKGTVPILVATDVAARGLDIDSIRNVVNYDVARDIDSHVHRIGRTGRAGLKGKAYTLITRKQARFAGELVTLFERSGQSPPDELLRLAMENNFFRKRRAEVEGRGVGRGGGVGGRGSRGGNGGGGALRGQSRGGIGFAAAGRSGAGAGVGSPQQGPVVMSGFTAASPLGMSGFNATAPVPPPSPPPVQNSPFTTGRKEMQQTMRNSMRASFASKFASGGRLGGGATTMSPNPIPRQTDPNPIPQKAHISQTPPFSGPAPAAAAPPLACGRRDNRPAWMTQAKLTVPDPAATPLQPPPQPQPQSQPQPQTPLQTAQRPRKKQRWDI